jgi:CRISPR-associated protein Csm4
MGYFLYKLDFTTALHIGSDNSGSSLDNTQMSIHSDTIFSALCSQAVKRGQLEQLVCSFAKGQLCISDALPYYKEELYLPKPILFVSQSKPEGEPGLKKKFKALQYIPLSLFDYYLKGIKGDDTIDPELLKHDFGQMTIQTRVAIKGQEQPLPYHVAAWRFAAHCGLYLIVRYEKQEDLQLFTNLLQDLSWEGIGGKQSSGWGKFELRESSVPARLISYLEDEQARYQMLIGTALPLDEELESVLKDSWYGLLRRGGFVRSESYAPRPLKKRSIYMLAPGSCLSRRFSGGMFDLSQQGSHPVWRSGNTLFVGVNI